MAQALILNAVGFVFVTLVLLLVLARARFAFPWRLALAVAGGAVYVIHYVGLVALTGWPSNEPLPGEFDVLGTRVVEPDRVNDEAGRIELWIREPGNSQSRLYAVPYSPAVHEEAERAQSRLNEGHAQRGRNRAVTRGGSGDGRIAIEDKPPPRLPLKRRD